jgi:hypothetical protein
MQIPLKDLKLGQLFGQLCIFYARAVVPLCGRPCVPSGVDYATSTSTHPPPPVLGEDAEEHPTTQSAIALMDKIEET